MKLSDSERKKMLAIFAANLPNYRKMMKLSQEEFGDTIGITRQTVSSIERGAYPLTWSIFLSCLFVCTGQPRARKLIMNSYADEPVLLGFLNELVGDKSGGGDSEHSAARQIYFGVCTVVDDGKYSIVDADAGVAEMLGIAGREKEAGSYMDYIPEEDREAIEEPHETIPLTREAGLSAH